MALYHDLVTFNKLLRVAAVCNRAEFKEPIEVSTVIEKRECYGEPDDVCLLKFAEQTLYDRLGLPTAGETDIVSKSHVADLRARYRIACEVAFNQVSKFHATVCELPPDDNDARGPTPCSYMVLLKGAPERVFERCQFISVNGEARVIDEKIRNLFAQALIDYGTQGERLLGFAELPLPEAHFPRGAYGFDPVEGNFPLTNLCFLGLLTEDNPPRPEVPNAVAKCRSAGIKVVMITGDHPYTGKSLRDVIISTSPNFVSFQLFSAKFTFRFFNPVMFFCFSQSYRQASGNHRSQLSHSGGHSSANGHSSQGREHPRRQRSSSAWT